MASIDYHFEKQKFGFFLDRPCMSTQLESTGSDLSERSLNSTLFAPRDSDKIRNRHTPWRRGDRQWLAYPTVRKNFQSRRGKEAKPGNGDRWCELGAMRTR
ncbi:uncharacterized protein LOC128881106 [Hylaeus volcanicus]|uniref:uncharacterized protein LOC128881106 n=1 Tax=Hylaeus volcanicus TaxID=313075 RepID=UPI0023B81CD9|nr:uncharacterized protein LOC128881106 [Hylaeus volcanicus]